jgi:hypothetical protein
VDRKEAATALSDALVDRLQRVIPRSHLIHRESGGVMLQGPLSHEWVLIGVESIVDQEGVSLEDGLTWAARGVLSTVQDDLAKHLSEPWPAPKGTATLPTPVVEIIGRELCCWYGEKDAPILELPPIPLPE